MSSQLLSIEDEMLIAAYAKRPLRLVRGSGTYVWTDDERRLIDFSTGYGVAILGHSPHMVTSAIADQVQKLMVCHGSYYNDARENFLKTLKSTLPSHLRRTFLCNSGAEAVEAALKLAIKHTGKKRLVSFQGAYHGKTLGALAVTWAAKYREPYQDLLMGVEFAKYGDIADVERLLDNETAAVVVEPIQGEAGVRVPASDFLRVLEENCRATGALLIVDEVQTGLARTGRLWAHEHWGVIPDMMCFGKGLASGVPVGCVTVRQEIASAWSQGEHTTTFGGNPVTSAAATATLVEIVTNQLWLNAEEQGIRLRSALQNLSKEIIREVRGMGLMLAVETRRPCLPFVKRLLEQGLLVIPTGINVVRMLPPVNISSSVVDEAIGILESSFQE